MELSTGDKRAITAPSVTPIVTSDSESHHLQTVKIQGTHGGGVRGQCVVTVKDRESIVDILTELFCTSPHLAPPKGVTHQPMDLLAKDSRRFAT